jgi:3-dehydroquinate dehydratase II
MTPSRVGVLHGVNLDQLGRRPPEHYTQITLAELEVAIGRYARDLGLTVTFEQTNHEGVFCEALHEAAETADALILNPGAWTHYSYAIRDALEIAALPAVEVHLSAVDEREEWRRRSVIADVVIARVSGKGPEGYREALEIIARELEEGH